MEYTCPICSQKMPRDLTVFMQHAQNHVVDAVKKHHPDWAQKDGLCPKCVEYFKRQISGQ